jgi:hypothetical protein
MTPDGHVPVIGSTNGDPKGPRVKRAGWSGWWVYDEQQRLIPDPDGPEPRRLLGVMEPPVSAVHPEPQQLLPYCPAGHDLKWRRRDKTGHLICDVCKRFARMRAKRRKAA